MVSDFRPSPPAKAGVQGQLLWPLVTLDSRFRAGLSGEIWSHAKPVLVWYRTMQQSSWPGLSRPSTSFDAGMRRHGCADQVRARRLQIVSYQATTCQDRRSTFVETAGLVA